MCLYQLLKPKFPSQKQIGKIIFMLSNLLNQEYLTTNCNFQFQKRKVAISFHSYSLDLTIKEKYIFNVEIPILTNLHIKSPLFKISIYAKKTQILIVRSMVITKLIKSLPKYFILF